jgi:hypothetical protein
MPYTYGYYSFQHPAQSAASQETIDKMEADGWDVHTAVMAFTELCVLWHKPRAEDKSRAEDKPRRARKAAAKDQPEDPVPEGPVPEE